MTIKTVYHYDENGKITATGKLDTEVFDEAPYQATIKELPKSLDELKSYEEITFDAEADEWNLEVDARGTWYDADGNEHEITELGDEPDSGWFSYNPVEREEELQKEQARERALELSINKNVLKDDLSENELREILMMYPKWKVGVDYEVDDLVRYDGHLYVVIQAHTSQSDWAPNISSSLFSSKTPDGIIEEWVQPEGSHDAYNTGDEVLYNDNIYKSTIDDNVWSPDENPDGWELQE